MKQKSSRQKISSKANENVNHQVSSGELAVSLSPPDYGIGYVDFQPDVAQRQEGTADVSARTAQNKTGLPDNLKAGVDNFHLAPVGQFVVFEHEKLGDSGS